MRGRIALRALACLAVAAFCGTQMGGCHPDRHKYDYHYYEEPYPGEIGWVDDWYEENDTPYTAAHLYGSGYHFDLECLDPDWYEVYLISGESLKVDVYFSHRDGDLDVAVEDEWGHELTWGQGESYSDHEFVYVGPVAHTGYYYICVYGYQGQTNAYDMDVEVVPY